MSIFNETKLVEPLDFGPTILKNKKPSKHEKENVSVEWQKKEKKKRALQSDNVNDRNARYILDQKICGPILAKFILLAIG